MMWFYLITNNEYINIEKYKYLKLYKDQCVLSIKKTKKIKINGKIMNK